MMKKLFYTALMAVVLVGMSAPNGFAFNLNKEVKSAGNSFSHGLKTVEHDTVKGTKSVGKSLSKGTRHVESSIKKGGKSAKKATKRVL